MALNFFGRGAGFSDDHTSAWFSTNENDLVIIDCPVSTFMKAKHMKVSKVKDIYCLITHTHGDHIGGLGLLIQYAFFVWKKPITVVAPSEDVAEDIKLVLTIEGNEMEWYKIRTAKQLNARWLEACISTQHSPQLEGKCFGYLLKINGKKIVYTGDTSTLEPFETYMPVAQKLYIDTSVFYGMIHLKLEEVLEPLIFYSSMGIEVYLMHLDDVNAAKEIIKPYPNISVVEIS